MGRCCKSRFRSVRTGSNLKILNLNVDYQIWVSLLNSLLFIIFELWRLPTNLLLYFGSIWRPEAFRCSSTWCSGLVLDWCTAVQDIRCKRSSLCRLCSFQAPTSQYQFSVTSYYNMWKLLLKQNCLPWNLNFALLSGSGVVHLPFEVVLVLRCGCLVLNFMKAFE